MPDALAAITGDPLRGRTVVRVASACRGGQCKRAALLQYRAADPLVRALQVLQLTGADGIRVVDIPAPKTDGGVLIEVHAAGIGFPDLLRSRGLYQERSDPPYTLGGEVAGIVLSAPAGSAVQQGDRVAGMARGAAAEFAVAVPGSIIQLPPALTFAQGAALPLNYQTVILALGIRARMKTGETVLVHGAAGGIGTAGIQIAKALGGHAIGLVSSDAKAKIARDAGADEIVRSDGAWKDEVLRVTGGRGVDLVLDPVGGDRMLDTMRVLATMGRWVVIGFTGGPIPTVPLNRVLLRNIDIVGVYLGGFLKQSPASREQLRDRLVALIAGGHVRPIVGSLYRLDEGAEAIREIAARRARGKVVVQIRD